MKADSPLVEEVRGRRMEISARFDHDLDKYLTHLAEIERRNEDRVVNQVSVIRLPAPAEPVKP